MQINEVTAYELMKDEDIADIHAHGYLLKHKKSGARVMLLSNEDENKVFNIAFRTPPKDSTGVAHILEHSVLCGSDKFPLKDPFVELVKGSLNTFLNAMTYPDKTMYPVASCNDQDFHNLMDVYLDAVFHPNIYKEEKIFRQEGWSYRMAGADAPLEYNGVVYNEMKGAFSSAEEVLDRTIFSSLFPNTPYGVESGGDPDDIPELTYEEFLNFHRKYYHPSNSYIYLYGNMDMVEQLTWLDEAYLSHYEAIQVPSQIAYQPAFEKPIEVVLDYPVGEDEPLEENAYLSYNVVAGDALDVELSLAFQVLDYALLSAPGAPLKQMLLDEKIGKDVFGGYNDGILQPFFSVVAKNADQNNKLKFIDLIETALEKLVKEGINKKSLEAGINYLEFRFREADFSSYPKGLMYGIDVFDGWLYDDTKPFIHLQQLDAFAALKEKIEQGYFEELIQKYLLGNNHASMVIITPKRGMNTEKEKQLAEKLQEYKASLGAEEIQKIVEDTKALEEFQSAQETPEALACIPMLSRTDIKKETVQLKNKMLECDGVPVLHHEMETNGIGYLTLLFDLKEIPEAFVPYLGILKSMLCYVDTEHYTYAELFNEINAASGGIMCGLQVFNDPKEEKTFQSKFGIKSKFLYEQTGFVFKMIEEIVNTSKFDDEKRLYEIIAQLKSRLQMTLSSSGNATAVTRATAYFSPLANFQEAIGGIAFYRVVSRIEEHFQEEKENLKAILAILTKLIFNPDNMLVSYTSDAEGFQELKPQLQELKIKLGDGPTSFFLAGKKGDIQQMVPAVEKRNEGFKTPGQVQYVAKVGNFKKAGFSYTGALRILKVILSYDYLWTNIRVKGGAYGCMNGFKRCGDAYFASYRDPNLTKTLETFDQTPEYVRNFDADEHEMTKYIIGTISGMDTPLNPSALGALSLSAYLNDVTQEDMQKERDEILKAQPEDIRALADLIEAVLKQDYICVVGSESAVEENKDVFMNIDVLN
ncbi:MAG: insulinase family protein [Lachnospiraceae bacterium]|nr:insulinase family protein [Lachnospiraceae bacterium]